MICPACHAKFTKLPSKENEKGEALTHNDGGPLSALDSVELTRLSEGLRKYDRLRVTVILSNGRVVQTGEWLSHSRSVREIKTKMSARYYA